MKDNPYQKTYFVPRYFRVKWTESISLCKSLGYEIASFETLGEAKAVQGMMKTQRHLFDEYTSVGGITTIPADPHNWFWVNSGDKAEYAFNWNEGEPNNWGDNEFYLSMRQPDFLFNDFHNNLDVKFLCQKRDRIRAQDVAAGGEYQSAPPAVCNHCVVG